MKTLKLVSVRGRAECFNTQRFAEHVGHHRESYYSGAVWRFHFSSGKFYLGHLPNGVLNLPKPEWGARGRVWVPDLERYYSPYYGASGDDESVTREDWLENIFAERLNLDPLTLTLLTSEVAELLATDQSLRQYKAHPPLGLNS